MGQLAEKNFQQESQRIHRQTQRGVQHHQHQQQRRRLITRGEKFIWSLGMVAVLILSITIVTRQAAIYSVNRDINHLQAQINSEAKVNNQLNVKVTELLAPDRIRKIARDQLGLKLNDKNVQVLPH